MNKIIIIIGFIFASLTNAAAPSGELVPLYIREFSTKLGISLQPDIRRIDAPHVIQKSIGDAGTDKVIECARRAICDNAGGPYFYIKIQGNSLVVGRQYALWSEYRVLEIYFIKDASGVYVRGRFMESVIR